MNIYVIIQVIKYDIIQVSTDTTVTLKHKMLNKNFS